MATSPQHQGQEEDPTPSFAPSLSFVFHYLKRHILPYKKSFFVFLLNTVSGALLTVTGPFLVTKIIEHLSLPLGYGFYFWIILYFLQIIFIIVIYRVGDYFVNIRMIPSLRRAITQEAMEELMKKNLHFYHEEASGDLASRIKELVKSVPDLLRTLLERLGEPFLFVLISLGFLYALKPFFAYALLCWILSCGVCFIFLNPFIARHGAAMANYGSKITGYNVDILSNIIPLRLFGSLKEERRLATPLQEKAQVAEEKMEWGYFFLWFFYGVSIFIFEIFAVVVMIRSLKAGDLKATDCLFIFTLHGRIFHTLWQVALDISTAAKIYANIVQSLCILYKPMDIKNYHGEDFLETQNQGHEKNKELIQKDGGQTVLQISKGDILLDQVEFSYDKKSHGYVFSCPHLFIPGGQKVGIVGQSGAGKTTFINLLMGFYDLKKGRILLDGQDISQVTKESLWKAFGVVSQEGGLFNRTVGENIAYGRQGASQKDIEEAAKMAHIHDVVQGFPLGYNTPVGERGSKLSGGQRQRLHLARCILKNAPILVLDEATSALDSTTENNIFQHIQHIMGHHTTLMIAHRLSTLRALERILVFSKGSLTQDGTHDDLLSQEGIYKELWSSQQHEFQNQEKSHIFSS